MPEAQQADVTQKGQEEDLVEWMRGAIHDLCQPLTALECRLFLGTLGPQGVGSPAPEEMREAIHLGLVQCGRMMPPVRAMRDKLGAAR